MAHPGAFESWADARFDNTVTFAQPIAPLYAGRQAIEIVAAMNGNSASALDLLKGYWTKAFEERSRPRGRCRIAPVSRSRARTRSGMRCTMNF